MARCRRALASCPSCFWLACSLGYVAARVSSYSKKVGRVLLRAPKDSCHTMALRIALFVTFVTLCWGTRPVEHERIHS
eukprot:3372384-Amphidinium_carterae.1